MLTDRGEVPALHAAPVPLVSVAARPHSEEVLGVLLRQADALHAVPLDAPFAAVLIHNPAAEPKAPFQ
ncbi:hypothetical protein D3C74_386240 [compost metagenome]